MRVSKNSKARQYNLITSGSSFARLVGENKSKFQKGNKEYFSLSIVDDTVNRIYNVRIYPTRYTVKEGKNKGEIHLPCYVSVSEIVNGSGF